MKKTMKKAIAFGLSLAMAVTMVNVPGKKSADAAEAKAASVTKAATATSGDAVNPYNAFIAFQLQGYWVSRDEQTSEKRGLTATTIDGKASWGKYDYRKQFVSNNGTITDKNKHAVDGGFEEPDIVSNGRQVMKMNSFDVSQFQNMGDDVWGMLHISTTIPVEMKGVKCTDVDVYIDDADKPTFHVDEALNNQESATSKGACYDFYIIDRYQEGHKTTTAINPCDKDGKAIKDYQIYPKKNMRIEYTLSGVDFTKKIPTVTYTGVSSGLKFEAGDFKYQVSDMSMSDGTKGKVKVAGLSIAGKKKASVKMPTTVKYSKDASYKVTGIKSKAFQSSKKLKKITLNNNATSIPSRAFAKCTKLTTVKFGTKIKSIGASAFSGCTSLKSITLGKKTKSIGGQAFAKCKKLSKIAVSQKVKVGKKAFNGCKKKIKVTGKKANKKFTVAQIQKSGYKKVK